MPRNGAQALSWQAAGGAVRAAADWPSLSAGGGRHHRGLHGLCRRLRLCGVLRRVHGAHEGHSAIRRHLCGAAHAAWQGDGVCRVHRGVRGVGAVRHRRQRGHAGTGDYPAIAPGGRPPGHLHHARLRPHLQVHRQRLHAIPSVRASVPSADAVEEGRVRAGRGRRGGSGARAPSRRQPRDVGGQDGGEGHHEDVTQRGPGGREDRGAGELAGAGGDAGLCVRRPRDHHAA
mmetsp:Transcript_13929/g.44655  ORF Transcript_13929/g.44655 Transcript_13929/m.44655 type:complete len:231 (-) Transcript_13929:1591-2283(-)